MLASITQPMEDKIVFINPAFVTQFMENNKVFFTWSASISQFIKEMIGQ
jgi:hypothetical protein